MVVLVNCFLGFTGWILEVICWYYSVWFVWIIEASVARGKLRFYSDHGWMRFRWLVYGYVLWIWLWGCLRKLHLHRSKVSISFFSDGVLQEFVLFFGLDGSFWIVVALMEESHCRIRGKVTDSPLGSRYFRRSYVQGKSREFGIDIGSVLGILLRLIVRRRNPCRSAVWDLISIERCFQGMAYYDCPDRILGFVILSASVEGKFSEADLLGAMIVYLSTLKTESCVSLAVLTKLALNKGKAAMVRT